MTLESNNYVLQRMAVYLDNNQMMKLKNVLDELAHTTATLQTISLIPKYEIMQPLRNDYVAMANMFYGKAPGFDEILSFLSELENEIHNL